MYFIYEGAKNLSTMQAKAALGSDRRRSLSAETPHGGDTPAGNSSATHPGSDCSPESLPSGQESARDHLEAAGLHYGNPGQAGKHWHCLFVVSISIANAVL